MIQRPVRRCPECGYAGRTATFLTVDRDSWVPAALVCPRCGHDLGWFDPRLQ